MANALYGKGRQKFLEGAIAWLTDDIKISFVDAGVYTLSIDVDEFFDDIPSTIADSGNLTGKSSTLGVADATDETLASVSGAEFEYIVIWKDTATPSTSPLIACIDTATGLPCTPNGGDIIVQWDSGSDRIFKL